MKRRGVNYKTTIYYCFTHGDLSLPFFIELSNTGKSIKNRDFNQDALPEWFPEIINNFQGTNDAWYCSFHFQDEVVLKVLFFFMRLG